VAGWTPGPVLALWKREKFLCLNAFTLSTEFVIYRTELLGLVDVVLLFCSVLFCSVLFSVLCSVDKNNNLRRNSVWNGMNEKQFHSKRE
jgi:hypothetical protein